MLGETVEIIRNGVKLPNTVELGEVTSLRPFKIKIGEVEYSSENFEIWSPRPRKIIENEQTEVKVDGNEHHQEGYTYYKEYDLTHEIDREYTLEFRVGDIIAVQDNGQHLIVLGVMHNIKEVITP